MNKEIYSSSNKIAKSLHVLKINMNLDIATTLRFFSVVIISMTGYIFLLQSSVHICVCAYVIHCERFNLMS